MRILVTGSAGFIGGHLVRHLAERGHVVIGLDRRIAAHDVATAAFVQCDILDADAVRQAMREAAPEVVLHLAAVTHLEGTSLGDYASNIAGVENMVAAIRATSSVRRSICTSTQLVQPLGRMPAHDTEYDPATLYGQSKVETERIWRAADGAGREWCIVRPTTIWGPNMNPHYLTFFRMLAAGRYVHVGSEVALRTYGYVENTAYQFLRLAAASTDAVSGRLFYLGDYEPLAIADWAERFRATLGAPAIRRIPVGIARLAARAGDLVNALGWREFPFNSFRLSNVVTSSVVDLTATKAICGPLPVSLDEGVRRTAAWLATQGIA